jgi:hypothetical protein
MTIIHDVNNSSEPLPRRLTPAVAAALKSFPVVVVTGARQTGKSTLIHDLLKAPRREYYTLDDIDVLERAESEPDALVADRGAVTLDEIQRSPKLLLAIKRAVDRDRRPGRFLLSGSANLSLLERVSETLAGRAVYLTIYPFTVSERRGLGGTGPWDAILRKPGALEGDHATLPELEAELLVGGFPPVALSGQPGYRRQWLDGYVRTYLERDLQMLAAIHNLVDFRRLMRIAALRTGALLNQSELARDAGLAQPTAHRYLNLLEASYLLHRLPAYAVNRTKRLIKSPKLYFCDTGLAAHLAGIESAADLERSSLRGPLLETLVLSDLLAWRESAASRPEILYWRSVSGIEIDFIVETDGRVFPVEVKATSRPRLSDIRNLQVFLEEYGKSAPHGLLVHTGTRCEQLAARIWAMPLSVVLGVSNGKPGARRPPAGTVQQKRAVYKVKGNKQSRTARSTAA